MATVFDMFFCHALTNDMCGLDYVDLSTMKCVDKNFNAYCTEGLQKHEDYVLRKAVEARMEPDKNCFINKPHSINLKHVLRFIVPLERHCRKNDEKIVSLVNGAFNDVVVCYSKRKTRRCAFDDVNVRSSYFESDFTSETLSTDKQANTINLLGVLRTDFYERNLFLEYLIFVYVSELIKTFNHEEILDRNVCILGRTRVRNTIWDLSYNMFDKMNKKIIFYPLKFLYKIKNNIGIVRNRVEKM